MFQVTLILFFSFMEWAQRILLSVTDDFVDQFRSIGIVEALASIFKVCPAFIFYFCTKYHTVNLVEIAFSLVFSTIVHLSFL